MYDTEAMPVAVRGQEDEEDVLSSGFDAIELEESSGGGAPVEDAADFSAWPGMMADVVNVSSAVLIRNTTRTQTANTSYHQWHQAINDRLP